MSISMPRAFDKLHGVRQHGQRLQAQKVELHEARRLNPFHVELRDRHFRARIAVERRPARPEAGRQ